jgi:hypothetical protein
MLQSLEDYNKETKQIRSLYVDYPRLNGLACPKCGRELYDSNGMVLTSNPPQKQVHCNCGFVGYKLC